MQASQNLNLLYAIKVKFTNKPQTIDAITATRDLLILVNRKKVTAIDKRSVRKKFCSRKVFSCKGKCLKENINDNQVKTPSISPSYTKVPLLLSSKLHFNR